MGGAYTSFRNVCGRDGRKDPATRNDFVNDIVNDAGVFHRRRWISTIVTISSKLDMLTFDRR